MLTPSITSDRADVASIQSATVVIAIVNYRTAQLTISCLRSLAQELQTMPNTQVVVVDNNSGNGSVEAIQQAIEQEGWSQWARLLASPQNGGFSYGNNLVIRPALASETPPDYLWVLNPDTEIRPGALQKLVEFMQDHPQAGICGSSFEEANGDPWPIAFRFPTLLSELESGLRLGFVSKLLSRWCVAQVMTDQPAQVDWLPGASMLIRRQVFETVGLMDEGYFLYFEETDFCLQAVRQGWQCWYVPESRVMHIAGQSTGVTAATDQPKRLPQYWFDSRRRYFVKNHGRFYAAIVDALWAAGFVVWRGRRLVQQKPDSDPPYLLQDILKNSAIFHGDLPDKTLASQS